MEYDFYKIVTNRPDKKAGKACPFCNSTDLQSGSMRSTLVGGGPNVNHVWIDTTCRDCHKSFTIESKGGNTWVTGDDGLILQGIPSCFESYIYTCSKCGGNVKRQNIDDQGRITGGAWKMEGGKAVKMFKTIFKCESCHEEVESEQEHYYPKE
jgi:DNA-directed RNA polymerase subunit RPC12/RpoP